MLQQAADGGSDGETGVVCVYMCLSIVNKVKFQPLRAGTLLIVYLKRVVYGSLACKSQRGSMAVHWDAGLSSETSHNFGLRVMACLISKCNSARP
jgi:hypothetical protein